MHLLLILPLLFTVFFTLPPVYRDIVLFDRLRAHRPQRINVYFIARSSISNS